MLLDKKVKSLAITLLTVIMLSFLCFIIFQFTSKTFAADDTHNGVTYEAQWYWDFDGKPSLVLNGSDGSQITIDSNEITYTETIEGARICGSHCIKYVNAEYTYQGVTYYGNNNFDFVVAHNLVFVDAVEPTCETSGSRAYYLCQKCGKIFEDEAGNLEVFYDNLVIPPKHSLTYYPCIAATCDREGRKEYYQCEICKKYFTDEAGEDEISYDYLVIQQLTTHNLIISPYTEPTEETTGYYEHYRCQYCGKCFWDNQGSPEVALEEVSLVKVNVVDGNGKDTLTLNMKYTLPEGKGLEGYTFLGWTCSNYPDKFFEASSTVTLENCATITAIYAKLVFLGGSIRKIGTTGVRFMFELQLNETPNEKVMNYIASTIEGEYNLHTSQDNKVSVGGRQVKDNKIAMNAVVTNEIDAKNKPADKKLCDVEITASLTLKVCGKDFSVTGKPLSISYIAERVCEKEEISPELAAKYGYFGKTQEVA